MPAETVFTSTFQTKTNSPLKALAVLAKNRLARWTMFAVILAYLLFQLSRIGFAEIAAALPTSPLFYLLSIGFVAAPVVAEYFSFQLISGEKAQGGYKLFLRKHVLNKAVMNFSGDGFLIQQLSEQSNMSVKRAAIILKDMTLMRAFVANLWIVVLVISACLLGHLDVLKNIAANASALVFFMSFFCLSIIVGALILFRKLTRLSALTSSKIAAIYLIRALFVGGILIAQWSLASPGTAIADWFIFLIVFSLIKKSPVGGEWLFASVVITIPGLAGGNSAAIAAMLIAIATVTQIVYVLGFVLSAQRAPKQYLCADVVPA